MLATVFPNTLAADSRSARTTARRWSQSGVWFEALARLDLVKIKARMQQADTSLPTTTSLEEP